MKISAAHGQVIERDGLTLFPMYHPAAALRNPRLRDTLDADARALREALAVRNARDLRALRAPGAVGPHS